MPKDQHQLHPPQPQQQHQLHPSQPEADNPSAMLAKLKARREAEMAKMAKLEAEIAAAESVGSSAGRVAMRDPVAISAAEDAVAANAEPTKADQAAVKVAMSAAEDAVASAMEVRRGGGGGGSGSAGVCVWGWYWAGYGVTEVW